MRAEGYVLDGQQAVSFGPHPRRAALANLKCRGGEVFRRPDEALQPQELSRLKRSSSKRFSSDSRAAKVAETSSCSAQSSR